MATKPVKANKITIDRHYNRERSGPVLDGVAKVATQRGMTATHAMLWLLEKALGIKRENKP